MNIKLSNPWLDISLDAASGRILALRNVARGLDLIWSAVDAPPWRLEIEREAAWLERFTSFRYLLDPAGDAVDLYWETDRAIALRARVSLPAGQPAIFFTIAAENRGALPIDKIEYPILAGIGPLTRAGDPLAGGQQAAPCLVHSQGTGFLFRDPLNTFLPEAGPRQGLRYSPYPEGFNGSTMQFMAYYLEECGGFYFATRDPGKAMKWYNFYKDTNSAALVASIMHQAPHVAPGLDFAPAYPVEISALLEGNWYEAAGRYKVWAVQQEWTRQGPLAGRAGRARWLLDEVGLCTFGVNAGYDRAAWLDRFHAIAGTPVFHILGANWPATAHDYMGRLPGGSLDEWLPARFSTANLAAIRRNGDRWAPFEFDLLCSPTGVPPETVLANRQLLPERKYSFDRYVFPFMCPATDFWHDFHVERDRQLALAERPDALYYDISANNVLMACRSPHHNHAPGGGRDLADAYARTFADTKAAMGEATGRYTAIGTEMISELLIPEVDFYQARAEASPLSTFEADFWRQWVIEGKVEKIPLFAYVYHEYGPLRMDGWGKLGAEAGDAFYWTAARIALWGGLFELNYEFSALEALDGRTDDPAEHYFHFAPRADEVDPARAVFVGELARTRAGWANRYLAYGVMLPPPRLDVPVANLDFCLYNCGQSDPHYGQRGVLTVPSVVCSAWRDGDRRAALLFVNLLATSQTVQVPLDPACYGLASEGRASEGKGGSLALSRVTTAGSQPMDPLSAACSVALTLPPRQVVGLELAPA